MPINRTEAARLELETLQSRGVLAVTVTENGTLEWLVIPDPQLFHEHVLIDFSSFEKKITERRSSNLKPRGEHVAGAI